MASSKGVRTLYIGKTNLSLPVRSAQRMNRFKEIDILPARQAEDMIMH